jgi:hypothetical protein
MSVEEAIRSQRTKALLLAVAWAIALNVPLLFLLGSVSVTPTIIVASYVYLKYSQGRHVVLWFRRFHTGMVRRTKFNRLLSGAVRGIGASVSIQDSSFRYSYQMRGGLLLLLVVLIVPSLFVCGVFGILILLPLAEKLNLPDRVVGPVILGVTLVLFAVTIWAVFRYVRTRAYVPLRPDNWLPGLDKILLDIARRKGLRIGTVLVKCGDAFWQQAVERDLSKATAAIVDVTEMSENVFWELQTVLRHLPPAALILAFPADGQTPDALPDAIKSSLARFGDPGIFVECPLFGYPSRARHYPTGSERAKAKELRAELVRAAETRRSLVAAGN